MSHVFLFTYFSLPLIFTLQRWPLAFLIFSPPLQNCHVVLPSKNVSFVVSRSSSLSRFFLFSFAGLPSTFFFLSLSLALYSKFVDMTIYLSLILETTQIQKQFPLSVFVFIDSLVVSALQDSGGYAISRQNNLELHLGCHTWLSYFTLVCLWCGRTVHREVGVRSHDYQIF